MGFGVGTIDLGGFGTGGLTNGGIGGLSGGAFGSTGPLGTGGPGFLSIAPGAVGAAGLSGGLDPVALQQELLQYLQSDIGQAYLQSGAFGSPSQVLTNLIVAGGGALPSFNFGSSGGFDLGSGFPSNPGPVLTSGGGGGGFDIGSLLGGGTGGGTGGSLNLFGIPGTPSNTDVFGGTLGGILDSLGGILTGVGGGLFDLLGGLLGGGGGGGGPLGGQQTGGIGGLLGALGLGGGGGGLGSALGVLGPLLALGGLAFGDDDQEQKTRVPPLSDDELGLLGINKELALRQLQAFAQQQGNTQLGNSFIGDLYNQMIGAQRGAESVNSPLVQQLIEEGRRGAINNASVTDALFGQGLFQDFQSGGRASADQLANIQGAADSAINQGLSDIGRFRDEGLNNVRLNSATRGLRPEDTPIQNQFADVAQESNRLAQNLVTNIRGQQFQQQLNFPLAANQQRLGQFQAATQQSQRRRELEEQLAQLSQQNRLNFGAQLNANNLGLVPNQTPLGVSQQLGNRLIGNTTTTTSGSQLDKLLNLGSGLGAFGNILKG